MASYRPRFTEKALRAAEETLPDHERDAILYGMTDIHVGLAIRYPSDPPVPALELHVLAISEDGSVLLGLPEESTGMS